MKNHNDRLNDEMFAARDTRIGKVLLFVLAVLVAIVFAGMAASMSGASPENDYPNPYYLVCNDPLLTNVTLVLADCGNGSAERAKDSNEDSPVVSVPTATPTPSETPIVTVPTTPSPETPTVETPSEDKPAKQKCNKGEGNGGEGCDPGNHPERGNDDENDTTPREDQKGSASLYLSGFIFVTFRIGRGKKEYYATVSSYHVDSSGKLWLFIWADSERGITGKSGYVPKGKVTGACSARFHDPHIGREVLEVLEYWL